MIDNIVGRPIVAGVDGSASALHAAHWAADEAAGRHIPLRLLHGVNTSVLAGTGGVALPQNFFDALEGEGRQTLAEAETAIRQEHPDLDVGVDCTPLNRLCREFAPAGGAAADVVRGQVREVRAGFDSPKILTCLPVLVERSVRHRLSAPSLPQR